ncbi:MAG: hypothetical protein ACW98I_18385, partial [Candidatus Hodarchaeales archaeon]
IDPNQINALIQLKEIVQDPENGLISLRHRSLANLYLQTYDYFDLFGEDIKLKLMKDVLVVNDLELFEYEIFSDYFLSQFPNSDAVMIHLVTNQRSNEFKKKRKNLLKIAQSFSRSEPSSFLSWDLSLILWNTTKAQALRILRQIDINRWIPKENGLIVIHHCIESCTNINPKYAEVFIERLDKDHLRKRVLSDPIQLYHLFSGLRDKKICANLLSFFQAEDFSRMLDTIPSLDIKWYSRAIGIPINIDKKFGLELIRKLNVDSLINKLSAPIERPVQYPKSAKSIMQALKELQDF